MKRKSLGLILAGLFALPVLVNADEAVANVKIGDKTYASLKEAMAEVAVCTEEHKDNCETTTVTVLKDSETSGVIVPSGTYVEIDLAGHTITFTEPTVGSKGTETQDMQLLKDSTITIKNGTLVQSTTEKSKMLIQNYANLTLDSVKLDAISEKNLYALSNNSGDVYLKGNTSIISKTVAFDLYGWYDKYAIGPKVEVDTTGTITGKIEVTYKKDITPTRELSLVVKNMNHEGEFYIQEGAEEHITIEGGNFTDSTAADKVVTPEGTDVYAVVNEKGETVYVAAKEEEVKAGYVEQEENNVDLTEAKEEEVKEFLTELEKELADVFDEESAKTAKEALEKFQLVKFYDIEYYGEILEAGYVADSMETELEKTVTVTVKVPTTLEKVKEGYTRTYKVVRLHETKEGKLETTVLDAKANEDGTVSFDTDRFSVYALSYTDTQNTTNPKTFDGISLYMIIASVSLLGLVSLIAYTKKTRNN